MLSEKDRRNIELAKSKEYEVCIWGAGYVGSEFGLSLITKRGITIDYYCDSNNLLWGTEVVDGIKCISPEELGKKDKVICFVMVGLWYGDEVTRQLNEMGVEHVIQFNDLYEEETLQVFPFMKRKKIAVYTCILGNYDDLMEPLVISPECDYFIISDRKPERTTVFQYIDIANIVPDYITDNTRKNRYCKINTHKIFSQYRFSIYFDGNRQLKNSMVDFIERLPKTRIIAYCPTPWKSIYREAMAVLQSKRDDEEILMRQMEKYWIEGMPADFGGMTCGVLIREHNNPICKKLMEEWWGQLEQFSKRDQVSLPYILWRNGYLISDVGVIESRFCVGDGRFVKWLGGHKK